MSDNIPKIDIKEFVESGLLHEVNRLFLHPIGLALEVILGKDKSYSLGGIWDYRDDPEGVLFCELDNNKIENVKHMMNVKHAIRKGAIGFVIQEEDFIEDDMSIDELGDFIKGMEE